MKFALVNPPWTFDGSIYFGCREPHLPLEYGYAQALLRGAGHEAEIFDGQLGALDADALVAAAADFGPDLAVVTTQPGSKSQENVQRRGFALLYSRAILVRPPGRQRPRAAFRPQGRPAVL